MLRVQKRGNDMADGTEISTDLAGPLCAKAAAVGWSKDLETQDGIRFHVRPATESDKEALRKLFSRLSADDLRHRFLSPIRRVGDDRLATMVKTDDPHTISFVAEAGDRIVAVATLVAESDYANAEFALSTDPQTQGNGVSWSLLDHLERYAASAGIKVMQSIETRDDTRALKLERERGYHVQPCPADPMLMIAEKQLAG